jgi:uncharacterized protein (TIGR02646 family)
MIRIVRPAAPPAILQTRGQAERQTLCGQFDADPNAYASGEKKFKFKATVYGDKSVKQALCEAQHDKCAFCESKVTHVAHGDVEHFRPKAGYQQRQQDAVSGPGYYWLAYEWTNLLFACQICNQQGKRNLFPLANPERRARSHHDDVAAEDPLLTADPEQSIGFREEAAYAKPGSRQGKTTIEVLGLNRPALLERRRDLLAWLRLVADQRAVLQAMIAQSGDAAPAEWVSQLQRIDAMLVACKADDAQYAAMVRAALAK